MSNYIITTGGELYHYGVKGMKWGVIRYDRQKNKVERLTNKRNDIAAKKGITSRSYMKTSRELYLQKSKAKLSKAKMEVDDVNKVLAKSEIKKAKTFKKDGVWTTYPDGNDMRKVYGYNLSKKQREAIATTEINNYLKRQQMEKVKKVTVSALSVAAPVLITAGVSYFNSNSNKIAAQLVKKNVDINKVNNVINKVNHINNKVNRVVLKAKFG